MSPILQEQLAAATAEAERSREHAHARVAELSELRALLGEAQLQRDEALRLLHRLKDQDRLIAELRPQAASNKLALQELRRLQREAKADAPSGDGASPPKPWFKAIGRRLRGQDGRDPS